MCMVNEAHEAVVVAGGAETLKSVLSAASLHWWPTDTPLSASKTINSADR